MVIVSLLLLTVLVVACAPEKEEPVVEIVVPEVETVPEVDTGTVEESEEVLAEEVESDVTENTVSITASGFSPSTLTVSVGTTVTWVNEDSDGHWPASNVHPTHAAYPTTGGCLGSTFDACASLGQSEQWSFTFNEAGEWEYHDHLRPSLQGTVIVTE